MRSIFGPVFSRRLGISLGIDPMPDKICPFDCLYCEVGRTIRKPLARAEYLPTNALLNEIDEFFATNTQALDYITFAGTGEPTLHAELGRLITRVKSHTDTPVAVLTGASLINDESVQRDLHLADLVVPSLDAATQDVFERINRPPPGLFIADIINGLIHFNTTFKGRLHVEILFVKGVNDHLEHVAALAEAVEQIGPQRTQLNTVIRPPSYESAASLSEDKLVQLAELFHGHVDVIASRVISTRTTFSPKRARDIEHLLQEEPITLEQLSSALDIHKSEVLKYLNSLHRQGRLHEERRAQVTYFFVSNPIRKRID